MSALSSLKIWFYKIAQKYVSELILGESFKNGILTSSES